MTNKGTSPQLLDLLNQALARELQVAVQYMLQHAIGAGQWPALSDKTASLEQNKFVASHSTYFLPGATLKKVAITEMRHAESIAERVVLQGGQPTTQPAPITIGKSTPEMLEIDREEERGAIELYRHIIDVAGKEQDDVTTKLFRKVLLDEEKHHAVFSRLLGKD
jgi:bacterioferritin